MATAAVPRVPDEIRLSEAEVARHLAAVLPGLEALATGASLHSPGTTVVSRRADTFRTSDAARRRELARLPVRGLLSADTLQHVSDLLHERRLTTMSELISAVLLPEAVIALHRALDPSLSYEAADALLSTSQRSLARTLHALQSIRRNQA